MSKTFARNLRVEVVRDTDYGRPWEAAVYVQQVAGMPGWHRVELVAGGDVIIVPARRIRAAKA